MAKSRSEIIGDIEAHIASNGGVFNKWVVGVTDSPRRALYQEHNLQPGTDSCISRRAHDTFHAREVAEYFQTVQKTRRGKNGGADHAVHVYAYQMKKHTKP